MNQRRGYRFLLWLCSLQWLLAVAATGVPAPDFPFAEAYFETVGDVEAIPDGSSTALAQDNQGFLWIGSQSGLLRFDGYRLRKFLHDANDPASLAGDSINALWVARDDQLWVGTSSEGVSVYNPASGRFRNFSHDPARPGSLSSDNISALCGDAAGGVWIGTEKGLDYLPPGATEFVHYRHHAGDGRSLQDDRIRSLLLDRHGRLWVGNEGGLQRFESAGGQFELIAEYPVLALFQAQDDKIWFGTRNQGAGWLDAALNAPPQVHYLTPDTPGAPVTLIAQSAPEEIWLAVSGAGLQVLAASDGQPLRQMRHDASVPGSLAHDDVRALLLDRAGLLWIGAVGGGLQRFNTHNHSFRTLRHSPGLPHSLSHGDVRSVLELADGKLLVAVAGKGIDILDRRQGWIGSYQPQAGGASTGPDNNISVMQQMPDGTLWVGTRRAGAFRLAPGERRWQHFSRAEGLPDALVQTMLVSRSGELWLGTKRGLAQWLPQSQRFKTIPDAGGKAMQESLHSLAEDGDGRIWAGSHGGLWVREPGQGLRLIRHEAQQPGSLIANRVNGLLLDHRKRLWIDTAQGLERLQSWDGQRAVFEHISQQIGRPARSTGENLLEDGQGRIWTETLVLDPQHLRYHELSKADGLDLGVNWFGAKARTRDGLLLLGGSGGLAIVDPGRFQPWNYQPPVRPTELKLGGIAQSLGALNPVLRLSPEQRDFSIEFSALDYSMPHSIRYTYRLQGYDHDWISTDASHRNASYGNLWPGLYTLQVRATNRAGRWSAQELSIPVLVLPAFWQTGWFLALVLLLISGTLYAAYRWRLARLRRKTRILQKIVDVRTFDLQVVQSRLIQSEKMAALGSLVAGIAHELNTPLGTALVAMSGAAQSWERLDEAIASGRLSKSGMAANSREGKELTHLAIQTATRAARLIRTLQSIAIKSHTDQRIELDLAAYLQEVTSQLHQRISASGCRLSIEVTPGLRLHMVADALTEALTRLLENCLDHAFAGQSAASAAQDHAAIPPPMLTLRASQDLTQAIVIEVADNGCGIAEDDLAHVFEPFFTTRGGAGSHTGLGLHIAWNQVTQRLQGDISIASTPGQGCTVRIRLQA